MIIYRVFDDEWEQIMGEGQVIEFAISQVYNCAEDFTEENLKDIFVDYKQIVELANRILNEDNSNMTFEQAKMLLNSRCFDVEEIEVY